MRTGKLVINGTTLSIWEENVAEKEMQKEVYGSVIRYFRDRGFSIHRDPHVKKHYHCISWKHHRGKKGSLEVTVKLSGRHFEVLFFQNLVIVNPNGGQYDFDKYDKMPYLIRKQFLLEAGKLLGYLHGFGYDFHDDLKLVEGPPVHRILASMRGVSRAQEPLRGFNHSWTPTRFKRDETGWPDPSEYGGSYNKDREGVPLRCGMFRYIRDRKGYLKRGLIYTNMNSMWQIVYGPGKNDCTYVSSGNLFTLQPTDCLRRQLPEGVKWERLKKELAKATKIMDFERAAVLRDLIYNA